MRIGLVLLLVLLAASIAFVYCSIETEFRPEVLGPAPVYGEPVTETQRIVALLEPPAPATEVADERVRVTPELQAKERFARMSRSDLEGRITELEREVERLSEELAVKSAYRVQLVSMNAGRWSPGKIVGPPDADPLRDDQNAWASERADMGEQWVDVGFAVPMRARAVRIHEVNVPGAVVRVTATDDRGRRHALWSGVDPTLPGGVFEVPFPETSYCVKRVRVTLDTNLKQGWNEIDAIELVGRNTRCWASDARASSYYGQ